MNRTPVDSSNIKSVGFEPKENVLHVEFSSGQIFAYKEVPQTVYEGLMAADSKGRYLAAVIKPTYASEKVG